MEGGSSVNNRKDQRRGEVTQMTTETQPRRRRLPLAFLAVATVAAVILLARPAPAPAATVVYRAALPCYTYQANGASHVSLQPVSTLPANGSHLCPVRVYQVYPRSLGEVRVLIWWGTARATYLARG